MCLMAGGRALIPSSRRMMALPTCPAAEMGHTILVMAVPMDPATDIPWPMAAGRINLAVITRLATAIDRPDRTRHTTARLPMNPPTDIRQRSPPHRIYRLGTRRNLRSRNHLRNSSRIS